MVHVVLIIENLSFSFENEWCVYVWNPKCAIFPFSVGATGYSTIAIVLFPFLRVGNEHLTAAVLQCSCSHNGVVYMLWCWGTHVFGVLGLREASTQFWRGNNGVFWLLYVKWFYLLSEIKVYFVVSCLTFS